MQCKKCGSYRIASVGAKCSDLCFASIKGFEYQHDGYVPSDMGIGGGDYVDIEYCLNCGQMIGTFPIERTELEEKSEEYNEEQVEKEEQFNKDSTPIDINNYTFDIDKPDYKPSYGEGTTFEEYINLPDREIDD